MKETAMPPYPWQTEVWRNFCESITLGRLPHALLVHGVEGLGVEDLSHSMARYLLCQAPIEDVACGRCKGCTLISAGSHPDIFVLKREDAAQIKVDQVRACVEFVAKTSHFDHFKVVLVEEAERMNVNAANALLKSLEEPQGLTIFVLVSSQVNRLLATIRSRCQSVHVKPPKESDSLAWLAEQSVDHAKRLLNLAGAAPLKAKLWSESNFIDEFEQTCSDLCALINGMEGVLSVSKRWQSKSLIELLEIQVLIIDSVIKSEFIALDGASLQHEELVQKLHAVEATILFRLREGLVAKVAQALSFSNLNESLVLEELAADWFAMKQLISHRATIARV